MALFANPAVIQQPNQLNGAGDPNALKLAEYTGEVERVIAANSVLAPMIPKRSVRGTNTIRSLAHGKSTLQVLVPGEAPQGTKSDVGRNQLTVDTVVLAREITALLDEYQTSYDYRMEIGYAHGEEIAEFTDQAFFIQAAKAAMLTESAYSAGSAGKPAGFKGGSLATFAQAADALDPALLMDKIRALFVTMENKKVVPRRDGVILAFKPEQFYALQAAEEVVNGSYVTADGTTLNNIAIFKAFGCPVVSTTNLPVGTITGHKLSNANNSNAYDGDFSKLVGLAFSPKALLAGESIPLQTEVHYDAVWKSWFIDAWTSFGVTPNRAEYAGGLFVA